MKRNILVSCVVANCSLTIFLSILIAVLGQGSRYFRWGPSEDLVVVNVRIDTYGMYTGLVLFILLINGTKMIVQHLGWSILGFSTFNPDAIDIYGYNSMTELNVLTNLMQISDAVRFIFEIVVGTTQIDLGLWAVVGSELTGVFVVRYMLLKKKFHRPSCESYSDSNNNEELTPLMDM